MTSKKTKKHIQPLKYLRYVKFALRPCVIAYSCHNVGFIIQVTCATLFSVQFSNMIRFILFDKKTMALSSKLWLKLIAVLAIRTGSLLQLKIKETKTRTKIHR